MPGRMPPLLEGGVAAPRRLRFRACGSRGRTGSRSSKSSLAPQRGRWAGGTSAGLSLPGDRGAPRQRAPEELGPPPVRSRASRGNVGLRCFASRRARACASVRSGLRLSAYRPLPHDGVQPSDPGRSRPAAGRHRAGASKEEIARTVDENGKTRGLWFDWEMKPYCGGRYRVLDRVERIIDERNGQMIEISSDCVILDGVVCSGEHSHGHWFCPRATYPYWREAWLQRVDDVDSSTPRAGGRRHAGPQRRKRIRAASTSPLASPPGTGRICLAGRSRAC